MKLALTGKIFPVLSPLLLTPDKVVAVYDALQSHVEWPDLLVILYFGWTTVPLAHLIHEFLLKDNKTNNNKTLHPKEFEDTWLYTIATLFSQAVRISLLVFLADCVAIVLAALGCLETYNDNLGSITARLVYTIWIATKVASAKTSLLTRAVGVNATATPEQPMGQAGAVMDTLLNLVVVGVAALFLLDLFQVDALGSSGFTSIIALCAMQALVLFIASKDLVEQFRK
jgi:small-conductance mechanosensitive channel